MAAGQGSKLTVTAEGREFDSPVGKEGEFYLEDVPAGRHPAVVEYRGAACRFVLEVLDSKSARVSLGTVRCAQPAGEEARR